jgi:hypothetical protein
MYPQFYFQSLKKIDQLKCLGLDRRIDIKMIGRHRELFTWGNLIGA